MTRTFVLKEHRVRPIGVRTPADSDPNFPLAIPVWKIASALAYGNAVVFKPSKYAVGVGARLVQLAHRSLPSEMLAFMPVGSDLVERMIADVRVDGVPR